MYHCFMIAYRACALLEQTTIQILILEMYFDDVNFWPMAHFGGDLNSLVLHSYIVSLNPIK